MPIKKIEAGRVITQDINEFIGTRGTIWYDEDTGEMRLHDGNPGGISLGSGGGGYVLSTATTTRLGGVRIGAGISISPNGTISVNTGTPYTLTIATTSTLGGVKIGTGLTVGVDGTISVNTGTPYTLTVATTSTLGGVKIGAGIDVSEDGTISVNTGTTFNLTTATTNTLGGVKIGAGIDVVADGTISVVNTSTLQSVTNLGSTTSNAINITSIAATTSTTTGALIVAGGVGIGGDLFVGGDITGPNGSLVLVATTSTAPTRQNGQLWFNSEDGRAYIKYDGNWVDLSPTIVPPISTYLGDLTIDGTTISTIDSTLTNIYIDSNLDVSGNINAPSVYDNGNRVVTRVTPSGSTYIGVENVVSTGTQTSFTIVNLGVQTLTAGTDTVVSSNTGTITVWTTSTLQSVTNRGATTNNTITITNNTNSTSTTTGGLIVSGGVGIGGDLYVGGKIVARELDIQYTTVTTTIVETDDIIKTSNTTTSISTTTGALVVAGGVGIGGDINVAGDIFINNDIRDVNGSVIHIATTSTAPTRVNGQLWFNSDDGRAYIKYDGTWVDLSPTIVPPISTYLGDLTIDGTTISTIDSTLTNIYIDSILDVSGAIYTNNYLVSTLTNISSGIGISVLRNNSGTVTVTNTGVLEIIAGVDTSVTTGTGVVIVNNTSTLQSVTNRGSTTSNAINITSLTATTSTITGALIVAGGVGIGGDLFINGDIKNANGSLIHIATTSTAPNRENGQLWFNSEDGRGYIKYEGTWVDFNPSIVPPTSTYLDGLVVEGTTIRTVDTTATTVYIDSNLDVSGEIFRNGISIGYGYTGSAGTGTGEGYTGSAGYTGSTGTTGYTGSTGTQGPIGYTGSAGTGTGGIIGLTSDSTSTVTLDSGFKFIPATNKLQDLGGPDNRFGKLYLAGQTIDLGGTIISTGPAGELLIQTSTGSLEKIVGSSLQLGSTSTDGVLFSVTDGTLSINSTSTNFVSIVSTGTVTVLNTETSTSTDTGALIVSGGVGIGGSVYAGSIYDSGNRVVTNVTPNGSTYIGITDLISTGTSTSFTIVNLGVQTLTAGTDTVVSSDTGTVTVWTNSTLQTVTDRGSSTTNVVLIINTTSSTSTTTGALVVSGGVGVAGDINFGGNLYQNGVLFTGGGGGGSYDQDLNTTSNVTFGNVTIGPGGVITFANGATQSGRAPRMIVDQDFIDAPDYDAFFATLLPGDFYWSVTYSQIKILVDYGGYYDWQDLTVYAA